jgi:hypothetical protein
MPPMAQRFRSIYDILAQQFGWLNRPSLAVMGALRWLEALLAACVSIVLLSGRGVAAGEALSSNSTPISIPLSGFISGEMQSNGASITLQVLKKMHQSSICNSIRFENQPIGLESFAGSDVFLLDVDAADTVNGHFSWSNGVESMFYVTGEKDYPFGTWIIGTEPG